MEEEVAHGGVNCQKFERMISIQLSTEYQISNICELGMSSIPNSSAFSLCADMLVMAR